MSKLAGGPAANFVQQKTKRGGLALPGHAGGRSWYTKGLMRGGVPTLYYHWMKPGSFTRRTFEKKRNPFVDLDAGEYVYYRDVRDPPEAMAADRNASWGKGSDAAIDQYNEYKIVPDIYSEGFQWKHKLGTEYQQWRSNTWYTPELIPPEHRGRLLCNFYVNVVCLDMRVAKFSPKDHRQWVFCVLYVGSGKGLAGWGRAIAPSAGEAKREATKNAFENLQGVDLETEGPVYPLRTNYMGCRVLVYPSNRLACNYLVADILCAFGFYRCGVKINEHSCKATNMQYIVAGVFEALERLRSLSEIGMQRGKIPHCLVANIYPYLEELRRRKGMLAMSPKLKDGGLFPANRVVDNRMPDHLKKGYYDDVYWKDFFAGNAEQLNEPRLGMRGDQLRAQLLQPVATMRDRDGNIVPMALQTGVSGSSPQQRRTLQSILTKLGKTPKDLGSIPIYDARRDVKLSSHMKFTFHLH